MGQTKHTFVREQLMSSFGKLVLPDQKEKKESKPIVILVYGLAGVGKTTLINDFVKENRSSFSSEKWSPCKGRSIDNSTPNDVVPMTVLQEWKTLGTLPKLFLLDGLECEALLKIVLKQFEGHDVRVIITARNPDLGEDVIEEKNKFEVVSLSEEEGVVFLRKKLTDNERFSDSLLAKVVQDVGGNILALNVVCQYLITSNVSLTGEVLRDQLNQDHKKQLFELPLQMSIPKHHYPTENIYQIYKPDFDDLSELPLELFRHLALCAPGEAVDAKFMRSVLKKKNLTVREIKNGINRLAKVGFVVWDGEKCVMSSLVSAFGEAHAGDQKRSDIGNIVEALLETLGELKDADLLKKGEPYAAHLLRLAEFADENRLNVNKQMLLWSLLTRYHQRKGDPIILIRSIEKQQTLLKKKVKNDHIHQKQVELSCALFEAHSQVNDYEKMEEELKHLKELLQPIADSYPLYTADKESWVAKKYLQLNKQSDVNKETKDSNNLEAENLLTDAMKRYKEKSANKFEEIRIAKELAVVQVEKADFLESLISFNKAEKLTHKFHQHLNAEERILKARIHYQLGVREEAMAGSDLKRYRKAWDYYESAYKTAKLVYAAGTVNLKLIQRALGRTALWLGRGEDAGGYYQVLIKGCREDSDAAIREKADLTNLMGIALLTQGRIEKALDHFQAAREIEQTQDSPDEFFLALMEINFGVAYFKKKAYDKAQKCFKQTNEMIQKLPSPHVASLQQKATAWEKEAGLIGGLTEKQRKREKDLITIDALLREYLQRPVRVWEWID